LLIGWNGRIDFINGHSFLWGNHCVIGMCRKFALGTIQLKTAFQRRRKNE